MTKKAQIQTGELIMVVMIVLVLLVVGLAMYANVKSTSIESSSQELSSLEAVDLAQEAASMQEISCGFAKELGGKCIDVFRMELFANLIDTVWIVGTNEYNYYRSKFGLATITINQTYPNKEGWLIYDEPGSLSSEIPIRLPLYIYDPISKTNSFGVMTVVKYT